MFKTVYDSNNFQFKSVFQKDDQMITDLISIYVSARACILLIINLTILHA